jgi:cytochrome c-type protein NapC
MPILLEPRTLLLSFMVLTIVLVAVLAFRPELTVSRAGKVLAFIVLFLLPLMADTAGTYTHVEQSKRTEFCLSCHIMEPYGRSLHVEDKTYLAAAHYQNSRIPRDEACFTCHTTYTMYGNVFAKMRGMRHVYMNYFKDVKPPLKLYEPYNNRECLHCHQGARSFEENPIHADPEMHANILSGKQSCLDSGCHDTVHNVKDQDKVKYWEPPKP